MKVAGNLNVSPSNHLPTYSVRSERRLLVKTRRLLLIKLLMRVTKIIKVLVSVNPKGMKQAKGARMLANSCSDLYRAVIQLKKNFCKQSRGIRCHILNNSLT